MVGYVHIKFKTRISLWKMMSPDLERKMCVVHLGKSG